MAERLQLNGTLDADQLLGVLGSRFIRALQVPASAEAADAELVERAGPADIVVTGDIPLASLVLKKDGWPLNPRGAGIAQAPPEHCCSMSSPPDTGKPGNVVHFFSELLSRHADLAYCDVDNHRAAYGLDRVETPMMECLLPR